MTDVISYDTIRLWYVIPLGICIKTNAVAIRRKVLSSGFALPSASWFLSCKNGRVGLCDSLAFFNVRMSNNTSFKWSCLCISWSTYLYTRCSIFCLTMNTGSHWRMLHHCWSNFLGWIHHDLNDSIWNWKGAWCKIILYCLSQGSWT